jgi:hypothetical protein
MAGDYARDFGESGQLLYLGEGLLFYCLHDGLPLEGQWTFYH